MKMTKACFRHRIAAAILCLIVVCGCVPQDFCNHAKAAEFPSDAVWMKGCSLTVWQDGRMGMNVYFTGVNPSATFLNATLSFGDLSYPFIYSGEQGVYYATCYLCPKEIGIDQTVCVRSNGKVCPIILDESGNLSNSIFCSAKNYLDQLQSLAEEYPKDAAMAKAINDYGTCARIFFQNNSAENAYKVKDVMLDGYCADLSGSLPSSISYAGSSIVLNEIISIRHYFSISDSSCPVDFYIGKSKTSLKQSDNLYYVEIPGIKAWDIDRAYRVTAVWNQTETWTIDYSVLSYAFSAIQNNSSVKLCELVKSMYWFLKEFNGYQSENRSLDGPDLSNQGDDDSVTLAYMNSKYTDDMPTAILVVPSNATAEEQYAARILLKYISQEDGYTPKIVSDNIPVSMEQFEISIGNTNRSRADATYSSNDSYCIQSYPDKNGVAITGVGQQGLMYGAMRFLEACGGYFYMSWNDLMQTYQNHFKVDLTNGFRIDYERAFVFTDSDICYSSLNPNYDVTDPYFNKSTPAGYERPRTGRLYALAMGMNGFFMSQYQLPLTEAGRESWYLTSYKQGDHYVLSGGNWVPAGQAHTLTTEILPADKYFASHPEWYATYNGSKNSTQLCLTTVLKDATAYGLILQHCEKLCANSDKNAEMQIISLSNNDGDAYCQCSKCKAERRSHGDTDGNNVSIDMVELLNKISADIHKNGANQNVYIDALAYTRTLNPPGDLTCDDHVIIRWAPIMRCYGHYLDSPKEVDYRNAEYYEILLGWLKVCKHVWIWDYNAEYRTSLGPYANVDVMQHDIKLYDSLGVEGVYLQSNVNFLDYNTELSDIRNYILGRILQDPTRDYEKELEFFTDAYYGECGAYVRDYMKRLEKQAAYHENNWTHRDKFTMYDSFMFEVYDGLKAYNIDENTGIGTNISRRMPDSEIGACEGIWQEINRIAQTEPQEVQNRLHMLEFSWRIIKSTLNVYEFSNSKTYASENQKLIDDLINSGVTRYNYLESKRMTDCIYPENHPDNWCRKTDYVMQNFSRALSDCNPNPTVTLPDYSE